MKDSFDCCLMCQCWGDLAGVNPRLWIFLIISGNACVVTGVDKEDFQSAAFKYQILLGFYFLTGCVHSHCSWNIRGAPMSPGTPGFGPHQWCLLDLCSSLQEVKLRHQFVTLMAAKTVNGWLELIIYLLACVQQPSQDAKSCIFIDSWLTCEGHRDTVSSIRPGVTAAILPPFWKPSSALLKKEKQH